MFREPCSVILVLFRLTLHLQMPTVIWLPFTRYYFLYVFYYNMCILVCNVFNFREHFNHPTLFTSRIQGIFQKQLLLIALL